MNTVYESIVSGSFPNNVYMDQNKNSITQTLEWNCSTACHPYPILANKNFICLIDLMSIAKALKTEQTLKQLPTQSKK